MAIIYMDHAATTRLSEKALGAMLPYFREEFGNPSAIYDHGSTAKNAVEKSRATVAKAIGALRSEVFFTSGGTESDNWAIKCAAKRMGGKGRHIISTQIEHNAVLKTLEQLEKEGYSVTYLQPDKNGQISPEQLEAAIRQDTVLISIMLANNVVGTVLRIKELSAIARKRRILFHTDAVQAVGHIPVNARELGVDFLSLSAHKFSGPKGVGALYCRLPNRLAPLIAGGGQEREMRSGTENVPGIVGMAAALEEAVEQLDTSVPYLTALRDKLVSGILPTPGVTLTGDPDHRLPGMASFIVDGIPHGVFLVQELNKLGVCVSSGSACSAASKEASHVLRAMGYSEEASGDGLRISLGTENTEAEVDYLLQVFPGVVRKLRNEKIPGVV